MEKVELLELISRINIKEDKFINSSESTRWKAYREAETIEDSKLFPLLREFILENDGKGKEKRENRNAAYFIYGRLLEKCFRAEDCAFYIQRLETETDKYVLSSILDRIWDWQRKVGIQLPPGTDISAILALSRDERWLVRHSALRALSACPGRESREALAFYLHQEDEKAYKYEIYYANIALQKIGEPEDIPLLERFLKSHRPDLRTTAQYAIQCIRERNIIGDKRNSSE